MATINRLIGVYDADGTLRGEVAYWIGARLGRRHCSLCDVTHATFTEKSTWKRCRSSLPVPFDTYHRNDQPDDVRRTSGDTAPVVIAETSTGFVVLLDDERISSIAGDPSRLVDLIGEAVDAAGLDWPS
ncbi:MAG: hypothetical protein O3C62_10980 [Actinomycetota bacterium]|nr:hypothetical protein [Actinomycetota bacterium]MDA2972709.1 hypothetical protein [Actinomycetota bacterium]MDA3002189.1 hypothetical protein [Actinomycetota bacterium]